MIATLVRAAAAFVGEDVPGDAERARLERRLQAMIGRRPIGERGLLAAGVLLLEFLPLFRYGARFSTLDAARAESTLRFLAGAPLKPARRLVAALRPLLQFAWFADAEAQERIGYDGPWISRVAIEVGRPAVLTPARGDDDEARP
jgi:hypothetical protein